MTLQETRWGDHGTVYDVEYPELEPWPGEQLDDLNAFQRLSPEERMRIIIRVLCGLVAIDEEPADRRPHLSVVEGDEAGREPEPPAVDEAPAAFPPLAANGDLVAGPTPGPSRPLPHLGLEHQPIGRARPKGWNTALLPLIGQERPY